MKFMNPFPLVGSPALRITDQDLPVCIEELPRGFGDVVRNGSHLVEHMGSLDDSLGYETLDDAFKMIQAVRSNLFDYVKPENFLFIFGQKMQAFFDLPFVYSPSPQGGDDQRKPFRNPSQAYGDGQKKGDANVHAVIFCKLIHAEDLERLNIGEKYKCGDYGYGKAVKASDLDEFLDRREEVAHMSKSLSRIDSPQHRT